MAQAGLNNFQVRKHNKSLFMQLMWRHKKLSKSQLAQLSGLSIPAASKIVQELVEEKKVEHSAVTLSVRGKSTGSYELPAEGPWTLCLCVKPGSIELQLADALLMAQGEYQQITISASTPESLLSAIENVWRDTGKQWPHRQINLALAVHGQVDPVTGVSQHMPQAAWKTPLQLKFLLEERLGVEVRVDNDCVMLALAEKWLNSNAQREFCVINVDYGIGSSFVINGEIFRGSLYGSGQIGHTIIEPQGKLCSCGRHGCLETVASLSALKQHASQIDSQMNHSSKALLQRWREGDAWIVDWAQRSAEAIGLSLYNFLNTLNINQIWLYGRSCQFGDSWLKTIVRQIDASPFDPGDAVKIKATNVHFGRLTRADQLLGIGYLYVEEGNDG